ncbi:branched-chain amino acid ABC transporter permease [Colwellia sp. 39_35_sub15_T18]|nr:branched-chain amino acid ABC transporter permease [Colwellia sp. 39_35_sub15_T18]
MLGSLDTSKNTTHHGNKQQLIYQATADILPLAIAVIPWGILCGSLAIKIGLSPIQAQLMSLLVFAGAAQLASLTLMGGAGALSSIFSSTFVISSRHLLYSAVFREHVRQSSFTTRCCTAFFLTDEMFAVTCAYLEKYKSFSHLYAISAGIVFYLVWNAATFIGITAGQFIPNIESLGLEFAIAATFIAIVIPSINSFSVLMSVLASGISVLILSLMNNEHALIIATFIGMATGFFTASKDEEHE